MPYEHQVNPEAKKISEEKADFWEYKLTSELIKAWVGPIGQRWNDLKAGLYKPTSFFIPDQDFLDWIGTQMSTLQAQTGALDKLVNSEMRLSWGAPGEQGSVEHIVRVCSYLADACERIIQYEESIRSARANEPYEDLLFIFPGVVGENILEILKIPSFIDNLLLNPEEGVHKFEIIISLPDGFIERFDMVFSRLKENLGISDY